MEFKKCIRCGCFFASDNDTCCSCTCKDNADIFKLKEYFDDHTNITTVHEVSLNTGIALENLNRYLQTEDFSPYIKTGGNNKDIGNVGAF